MRRQWAALLATIGIAVTMVVAGVAGPAFAGNGKEDYTNPTTLQKDQCEIYGNVPKDGVPVTSRTIHRRDSRKREHRVGVRYTYKGYAMVLDYRTKKDSPLRWGFMAQDCLVDPHAYGPQHKPLPDLLAVGGHPGQTETVSMSADHRGKEKQDPPIRVGSAGTLRSAPRAFVIGNVRAGDSFYITTASCGHPGRQGWVLGYAPQSGRWGYIEAIHLPAACR
jgi:hypothetical protein